MWRTRKWHRVPRLKHFSVANEWQKEQTAARKILRVDVFELIERHVAIWTRLLECPAHDETYIVA